MKIRAGDGLEQLGFPEMMSTPLFYKAESGERLRLLDSAYIFNVATYSTEVDPRWIYTYDYAPDQSWTNYRNDLTGDSYRQDGYGFHDTCFFRVCLRKINGDYFDGSENINDIIFYEANPPQLHPVKQWLTDEANRVANQVNALRTSDDLIFALLTDTHYVVNGTWEDTATSLLQVQKQVGFDGVIHLGDFTDGMVTGEVAQIYVNFILDSLKNLSVPYWAALGNHDANYFKGNSEYFTIEEQCEIYLNHNKPHYNVDFEIQKLRFIFLDSFNAERTLRYGYSDECIAWLGQTLAKTPNDWRVIIFSHLPPVTRLQFWAKELYGEEKIRHLMHVHASKILGWINGHNHADRIDCVESIPVVSVTNTKCEAFTEHKSEGHITPERTLDTITQEAWDVLIINTKKEQVNFVRYGSGADRIIHDKKVEWL